MILENTVNTFVNTILFSIIRINVKTLYSERTLDAENTRSLSNAIVLPEKYTVGS